MDISKEKPPDCITVVRRLCHRIADRKNALYASGRLSKAAVIIQKPPLSHSKRREQAVLIFFQRCK
ncbi:MAG: hypothetical protein J6O55_07035 [Lachnospiraceae bacterium]|nr:hypothetical protein [Lachnospiraceae bacterium]